MLNVNLCMLFEIFESYIIYLHSKYVESFLTVFDVQAISLAMREKRKYRKLIDRKVCRRVALNVSLRRKNAENVRKLTIRVHSKSRINFFSSELICHERSINQRSHDCVHSSTSTKVAENDTQHCAAHSL